MPPTLSPADPRVDGLPQPSPAATHRTTLATRVVLLVVAASLSVALVAGVVGTTLIRQTATQVSRSYLADLADAIAGQLEDLKPGYRTELSRLSAVLADQGIAVVTLAGRRPAGTDPVATAAASAAGLADLQLGQSLSMSEIVDGRQLLVEARAVPARTFALVSPAVTASGETTKLEKQVVLALLIGLAVAVVGGLSVALVMARPLRRTAAVARAMSAGARDRRAEPGGPQEVAAVAQAVNELADALQRSESRQRSFLTSVSHELRTPLTAISGAAQALADGIVRPDEVDTIGRTITAEAARLERMVVDLLDLARLGADQFRIESAPTDVGQLLREAAMGWQAPCAAQSVPLLLDVPAAPLIAVTDARRVRQVIDGLAGNALRVLPAGSPLVLAARADAAGVVLQVRDGGPGLQPEDYPVMFEPGVLHERYRGRRPGGGAGLGLALAHSLITRLGGTIHAGPAAEGGVAITVRLPARPVGEASGVPRVSI